MRGKLFVAKKPLFISSNNYLSRLKRKYKTKTAGYSGTLDPFAVGTLLIGTDGASRLFNYVNLEPKVYRAVLWLGAKSETLDIEGVRQIENTKKLEIATVQNAIENLKKITKIIPPKYSAKRINGKRAYELARDNKEVELKECDITVFDAKLLLYSHPFITFEVKVSKGTYVRTLGEIVAKELEIIGSLSYLERVREGKFCFENEREISIKDALEMPQNIYKKDKTDIILGKKLDVQDFELQDDGIYFVDNGDMLSIIEIKEQRAHYKLNNIEI